MKSFVKIIGLTLALVMMLSVFAACKKEDGKEDSKSSDEVSTSSSEEGGEIGNYDCELPDGLDFEEKEITLLCRDMLGQSDEFVPTGDEKNIISSAVYNRNREVERRLNIKFNIISVKDTGTDRHATVVNMAEKDVLNGSGEFDIIAAPAYTAMDKVLSGIFYNLKDVENLNLDKYYWAQGFNNNMEVGSAQYLTTGAAALSMYRFMYVTVYNNKFFADNKMEDIYDLVKSNRWTMEEQYKMAADIYVDDGDKAGERDEKDTYGFLSGARTTVDAYLASCDVNLIGRDNDNYYTYIGNQEKISGIADKMLKLFFEGNGSYIVEVGQDNPDNAKIIEIFKGGKVAMATMKVNGLETGLRNSEFEYSIAPLPKYDANQENYGTLVQDQVTAFALPLTMKEEDAPIMGAVLECLADESYKTTYLAYFETALSYQYLQNEESVEMLQIIYESIDFSVLAACYATDYSWNSLLRNIASLQFNATAQQLGGSTMSTIRKNLKEVNDTYKELLNK